MKEYYSERFNWIFRYTSKNFFYCLAKTLCIILGLPIYCVMVAVEMVLTFVNMIFCWIPILGMVIGVICKAIIYVIDKTFFICILTDLNKWRATRKKQDINDVSDDGEQSIDVTQLADAQQVCEPETKDVKSDSSEDGKLN